MNPRLPRRTAAILGLCLVLVAAGLGFWAATGAFSSEPSRSAAALATTAAPVAPAASSSPAATRSASPSAVAVDPPLPALYGSIGDSIGVAFDATGQFGPHPGHEWSMGTTRGDGVYSFLERFQALGADPVTVDAATAGARFDDAARQAAKVLAAAADLPAGSTAFVSIELGGNDACNATPPATFEAELRDTVALLRDGGTVGGRKVGGLPKGSRLLILSVPNILELRKLTADIPAAQDVYRSFDVCSRYLAATATPAELDAAGQRLVAYNAALARVCAEVEATDGKAGVLHCRSDQQAGVARSMYGSTFTLDDVSTLDYFHPSVTGQAKIADGAWAAAWWSDVKLPDASGTA